MKHSLGGFLKQRRIEKNLTQKDLAKLLFVSESTISKWENGVANPDITMVPKLSQILGVSEHELITASIDSAERQEKVQAKKWRTLSFTWSLFFYISYILALIPCFICDLAINKSLTWFWIVLSALLLAFTFTNLPKIIKRYKLILLPFSMYSALCLLLGVCCIYSKGNWFWIPTLSVLLVLLIIFVPIYIAKYKIFAKIRKYNDFVSIGVSFVMLNLLLAMINCFTAKNGYSTTFWWLKTALPIVFAIYVELNILICVRFLRINGFTKTSIILMLTSLLLYVPPMFYKSKNPNVQKEINDINILKANFSSWDLESVCANNIHLIIFLTIIAVGLAFLITGLIVSRCKKKK